jgi:hypothetical protein
MPMATVTVEQVGEDLVIRLPREACAEFDLCAGTKLQLARTAHGEVSLIPSDLDHRLREGRSHAFLRHLR